MGCLSSVLTKDGRMPTIKSLMNKVEVVERFASLDDPGSDCGPYERWLRTDVRDKLAECDAAGLLGELRGWKSERDKLVHALFGATPQPYDSARLRELVEVGKSIAEGLDRIAGSMRTLEKRRKAGARIRRC